MTHPSDDLFSPAAQDIEKFRRERARKEPARLKYLIWFTPRSGSSWLTDIAKETGRLSMPGEIFNPNFMPVMTRKMHAANMDQYIQILIRRRNTGGVFGGELTWYHLDRCFRDAEDFMRHFDGSPAIWLIREDIVLQAVSVVKMQQTEIAHSTEAPESARAEAEARFRYDARGIARFVRHIHRAETECEKIFAEYGIKPLRMSYEHNMKMGADNVLNAIAHHIGIKPIRRAPLESGHTQLRTERNLEFAEHFRADHADLLAEIAEERTKRLVAIDRRLPGRLPKAFGGRGSRRAEAV